MSKIKILENMIREIIKEEKKKLRSADYSTSKYYDTRTGKSKKTGDAFKDSIIASIDNIANTNENLANELLEIIPSKYDVYDSWPESLWKRVGNFLKTRGEL